MIKTLKYNQRSFLYAFVVTLGFIFLMNIELNNPGIYFGASVILYLIVLFEMFYIWFISREKLKQLDLPLISNYTKLKEFINHLLLPTLLFVSTVGFIYFNNAPAIRLPLVILIFIAFAALFINLKAFYLDKYHLEKNTYFVYDLIEMMIYFSSVNVVLTVGGSQPLTLFTIVMLIFVITFGLLLLNLYQFDEVVPMAFATIIIFSLISAVNTYVLVNVFSLTPIASSALQFLVYYLLFGVLRHKLEGTLSLNIFLEYLSIFLLAAAFLLGVTSA